MVLRVRIAAYPKNFSEQSIGETIQPILASVFSTIQYKLLFNNNNNIYRYILKV